MSKAGASLPYQFRPNKFVDRQIFFDLLDRYAKFKSIENAGYVSMGAYTMSDHSQIYRRFGINRLYSFDGDPQIRMRSHFNRPTQNCICREEFTTAVAQEIPRIRSELKLGSKDPLIVWFDYTDSLKEEQLNDIKLLLGALSEGDIARFTVNAHPHAYIPQEDKGKKRQTPRMVQESRKKYFSDLYEQLGLESKQLPERLSEFSDNNVPKLIVKTIEAASLDTLASKPTLDFELLSSVAYKDGANMVSVTGAMVSGADRSELIKAIDSSNWAFSGSSVTVPFKLSLNQMTLREYLTLDRMAADNADIRTVKKELQFETMEKTAIEEVYKEFKTVSRLYPSFLEVAT